MKILTFDIEEWFHLLDNDSTKSIKQWNNFDSRIQIGMDLIYDILEKTEKSATFFVVGWMAEKYPEKKITVVTKTSEEESNTRYAQGGIAVVLDMVTDSFDKHIEDTLRAGGGLSDPEVVKMVVQEAPNRLKEMIEWGAAFDTNPSGKLDLGKEGGHSEKRIVHHKDITGYEMAQALIQRNDELKNVTVYEHFFAVELITEHHLPLSLIHI